MPGQFDNPQSGFWSGFGSGLLSSITNHITQERERNLAEEQAQKDFDLRMLMKVAENLNPADIPHFLRKVTELAGLRGKPKGIRGIIAGRTDLPEQMIQRIGELMQNVVTPEQYQQQQIEAQRPEIEDAVLSLGAGDSEALRNLRLKDISRKFRTRDPLQERMQEEEFQQSAMLRRQLALEQQRAALARERRSRAKAIGRPTLNPVTGNWQQLFVDDTTGDRFWEEVGKPESVVNAEAYKGELKQLYDAYIAKGLTPEAARKEASSTFTKKYGLQMDRLATDIALKEFLSEQKESSTTTKEDKAAKDARIRALTQNIDLAEGIQRMKTTSEILPAIKAFPDIAAQVPSELLDPSKIVELKRWLRGALASRIGEWNRERSSLQGVNISPNLIKKSDLIRVFVKAYKRRPTTQELNRAIENARRQGKTVE